MFYITVEDKFSSAHQLREYKGKCENLHGHNWVVKITVKGKELDSAGMLLDFSILKKHLKEVLDYLDHQFINQLVPFDKINPSAENLCFYIYEKMRERILTENPKLIIERVDVWENEKSSAAYVPF